MNLSVTVISDSREEVELLGAELASIGPAERGGVTASQGFGGIELMSIVVLPLVATLIKPIAQMICAWIEQGGKRQVKINGIDIRGYSAKDIVRLLEKMEAANLTSPAKSPGAAGDLK